MARVIEITAIVLLLAAAAAFAYGIVSFDRQEDFRALYLLIVGGLALRASTDLIRPRGVSG